MKTTKLCKRCVQSKERSREIKKVNEIAVRNVVSREVTSEYRVVSEILVATLYFCGENRENNK